MTVDQVIFRLLIGFYAPAISGTGTDVIGLTVARNKRLGRDGNVAVRVRDSSSLFAYSAAYTATVVDFGVGWIDGKNVVVLWDGDTTDTVYTANSFGAGLQ